MEDYLEKKTDEELVLMWDSEDAKNVLYLRMLPILYRLIAPFAERGIDGYDADDLLQEASHAFVRAVSGYNPDKNARFRTYLWICVRSHLLNLAKKENSTAKNGTLVSLYEPVNADNPDVRLIDTLSTESDFEESAVRAEITEMIIRDAKKKLSMFELAVFRLFYMKNMRVQDIASKLGCSAKSVENTLYRIRTKFRNA